MPKKRTSMKRIREIVRLFESGLSQRQISDALKVSRPVVSKTIDSVHSIGLNYRQIATVSDSELEELFSRRSKPCGKADKLKEKFPTYAKELKRTGVTLQHLWAEYLDEEPQGLRYSQFCYYYQQWRQDERLAMHIEHKAGDKLFVDYTGKKLYLNDRKTGERQEAEVFVAILPASQLTYAEAVENQNQESFVRSNERALRFFGGVPSAIVPDNLKAGVLKASIYEPDLNPLFADFAEYYRTAVLPTRKRKPKDKAHVENAVKLIYQRIFAPLRDHVFYSLEELNQAIKERLEEHNNKKLTKMTVSRRELFEEIEKAELKALPVTPYPLKHIQDKALVQFNYHVELKEDHHYYSVPHSLKGKRVKLIYDDKHVSIYHENIRIVLHRRNRKSNGYSTNGEHMPVNHRFDKDWNPEKLRWWAGNVGDETLQVVNHLLVSKAHPEQAYKFCMGILAQAKKYGPALLNMACRIAWNAQRINYGFISTQLRSLKEQYEQEVEQSQLSLLPPIHENVRGEHYYQ